jgi:subtilase family serine protease
VKETSLEKAASEDDVDFFMDGFDDGNDIIFGGAGNDEMDGAVMVTSSTVKTV